MEASMITKVMLGVSALISLVYVVADEVAVNYMLKAANGASLAAANGSAVNFAALRREAQATLKDLQTGKAESGDRTRCADQAWPYYAGACLVMDEERQIWIVRHDNHASAPNGMQRAVNF
jgi:hypothetical protein